MMLQGLWKELRYLVVGTTLIGLNFLRLFYLERVGLLISVTVTITLFCTVVLASVGELASNCSQKCKTRPCNNGKSPYNNNC